MVIDSSQKSERLSGVPFASRGSRIPFELLHSLQDDGLVIFCGAGISQHFKLPDFKKLVVDVCDRLGRVRENDEEEFFNGRDYDAALGLIEAKVGKEAVRRAVREIFTVPEDADLATHTAFLQLATSKSGAVKLVTTNFDKGWTASS